ncbi:hypothetical protein CPB86DRAFT_767082 [Serendipita vermifera]|nr:hypothetical protein CPB86DRAFT_767082 [Serendipita vermifera]
MASAFRSDKKHVGDEKLIISMDIGTTQSAVSFSHLCHDDHPIARLVTKWPGQENATGDAKVPTVIAYQGGEAKFFGVEAADFMGDDDYNLAYWFKLHLHPESMKESDLPPPYGSNPVGPTQIEIPDLPLGVSLRQVYADFIKYLYDHTKEFFIETMPNGRNIWNRLESNIVLIFCHPNGWDVSQQSFLGDCAVLAGIVPQRDVEERVEFITEGEASVHYSVVYTTSNAWLQKDRMFVVIDAGGSTVDSNLYECKSTGPLILEEVCGSHCVQSGGVYVDRAAHDMLEDKLGTSQFNTEEHLATMVNVFEHRTKRIFDGTQEANIVAFGRASDNDRPHNILKGKLTLSASEVGSVFDDVVNRIMESCLRLLAERKVQHILLVGGFGESPYLRRRLRDSFASRGSEVVVVDQPSKKAAAEGAVVWYLKQLVSSRAARYAVGTDINRPYDSANPQHRERSKLILNNGLDGLQRLRQFDTWIEKDAALDHGWELTKTYHTAWKTFPGIIGVSSWDVYSWEGEGPAIWLEDEEGEPLHKMRKLCQVKADLSQLSTAIQTFTGPNGQYWRLDWEVLVRFGGTKLRARMKWTDENGKSHEGPISIIPGTAY